MFEQTFKNIDDILHKDAGCGSELDYVEQTSWILFLKYLDDLEKDRATAAELTGKTYTPIIDKEYQWSVWAMPLRQAQGPSAKSKMVDGELVEPDHHNALTGDDLTDFVNNKLFPYLKKFKLSADSADTIEYKIGEIFSELKNRIQSGYNLREVINRIDELRFRTHAEKHEMSHLYEDKIKNMGNAGRNGGEYYTPRPLITTIVKVVAPKIGDKIYDGAVGSAGFLCEAFDYLKNSKVAMHGDSGLSTKEWEILQKRTFYGKEKKSLAYIIGIMNMILHGVEAPNIIHTNTLAENLADIQEKDRYDVVLANPPFGGKERAEVQQNFPIKTGETASLFLQHFIKILKAGGKAGVVIKNTFLSNTDNATIAIRKTLLENCNLHTVLDLPGGTFTGAGVKTVVLFFEKGKPTQKVWFYQLNLDRNLGKTNPLNENDLAEFLSLYASRASASEGPETENSWNVDVRPLSLSKGTEATFDLSVKNPNKKEVVRLRSPHEILEEMKALDEESAGILESIKELI
jgi:type I restriction enzyme M protein